MVNTNVRVAVSAQFFVCVIIFFVFSYNLLHTFYGDKDNKKTPKHNTLELILLKIANFETRIADFETRIAIFCVICAICERLGKSESKAQ
jgi:hypothetical protein